MVSVEDLIVRLMPFPKELKEICRTHPNFAKALKINNPKRFVGLGVVITSYSPLVPEDEIIGFFTYDYKSTPGRFKQDFIVNVKKKNKEFVLYTRLTKVGSSRWIKDISQFFTKYSKGMYYIESHHPKFEDIPDIIKPRALMAIELATRLKQTGLRQLSKDELTKFDMELQKLNV
ncbi:MAG: hypothetical protein NTZ93_05140 [Candidatus Beckwithbacteria bacterium]|nr:hypothetical protein [Candidatus Beckwithbacteria bacterium]